MVYVAELDADVDDVIAAEYLYKKGVLQEVVCDPIPRTTDGKYRKEQLELLGIKVSNKMPLDAQYVFVGGALTEVAHHLTRHKIACLVMNGGFVGDGIMRKPLDKFKGKQVCKTFNFNCDVIAADSVLKSRTVENIVLVGKNVCHSEKNTLNGVWSAEKELLRKYNSKSDKRQHDMLACREGLVVLGMLNEKSYLDFKIVYPYNNGLKGKATEWGSKLEESPYRTALAAVDWRNE